MICSVGIDGGSLVMGDSVWPVMPRSTGGADAEFPMAGEPEEEPEADGGGRGPCCWASTGKANAAAVQAKKTAKDAVGRRRGEGVTNFARVFIFECAATILSLNSWIRLVKRIGGCFWGEGVGMASERKRPVVNFRKSVGPWRSWERASMASRRSWVRIPSAPPFKETKELTFNNRELLPITVASFSRVSRA